MSESGYWDSLDKQETFTDQEMEAAVARRFENPDWTDATTVLLAFIGGLKDPATHRNLLNGLVHPATTESWGDFTQAAEELRSFGETGISEPHASSERPDVLYSGILGDFDQSFTVATDDVVPAKAIVTLIWSPAARRWVIVAMGDYMRPDDIPPL